MLCIRESRDINLEFESQRCLNASSLSSSSLHSRDLPEGDLGLPSEPPARSDLDKVFPITFVPVARMRVTEAKAVEGDARKKSSPTCSGEVATLKSGCDLDFSVSKVTQA